MDIRIQTIPARESAAVLEHFPDVAAWLRDPNDDSDYTAFVATDEDGAYLGAAILDLSELGFGPLRDTVAGFLEEIRVEPSARRKGVGSALINACLEFAWAHNAQHVRWTVDYDNANGIAFYRRMGFAFIPNEDPGAKTPQQSYTVVAQPPSARQ